MLRGARHRADRAHRLREQRTDNDRRRLRRSPAAAPSCAPCGVPASSFTSSWMLGSLKSASAISAAFFIDVRGDAGIARRRQRQDQADADLAGADLPGRRLLGGLRNQRAVGAAAGLIEGVGAGRQRDRRRGNGQRRARAAQAARQHPVLVSRRPGHGRSPRDGIRVSPIFNRRFCPAKVKAMKKKGNSPPMTRRGSRL